ncbi:MAG: hypothetical protein R3200_14815, partial [Xanthomonadales bacterium]|nr:hypothetical protein [Xanthomonadales bacterium]
PCRSSCWEPTHRADSSGEGQAAVRRSDPSSDSTGHPLRRVLQAEDDAREVLEQARRDVRDLKDRARAHARQIEKRADERIRKIHTECERRLRRHLAELARSGRGEAAMPADYQHEQLDRAVRLTALDLIGAGEEGDE